MSGWTSPGWARVLAFFVGVSACSVDETGYGQPKDSGVSQPGHFEDEGDSVPTTDGGAPELPSLVYTSGKPLGVEVVEVTIIALPDTFGSLNKATLAVQGRGSGASVTLVQGGFVETLQAAQGDTVLLSDTSGLVARLQLDDPLDTVDVDPEVGDDLGSPDAGDTGGVGASPGVVQVGAGSLGVVAPYIAYVAAQDASALVAPGDVDVELPAEPGNALCVARVVAQRVTTSVCRTL